MATSNSRTRSRTRAVPGGAIAGFIGGMATFVWNAVAYLREGSLSPVLKSAGAPFFEPQRIMSRGYEFWPDLIGTCVHLLISAAWGVLFALLFYGFSKSITVLAGLFWGLIVWLVMYYVALPLVGLSQMARSVPMGMAILGHLWFGLFVGLGFLPFQRTRPSSPEKRRRPGLRAHDLPATS